MSETLHAGVARANITPPLGIPHAGWGAQTHVSADGVHQDLWATVLVLAAGATRVVLCDLDLCITTNENDSAIRQAVADAAGAPVAAVRLSMTHTHSGPDIWADYHRTGNGIVTAYRDMLPHLVAGAAQAAVARLQPVRAGAATGRAGLAVNRRQKLPSGRVVVGCDFSGFTDHEVPVIRVDAADGRPLACIFGYAMHPTILGPGNRLHSTDYPGVAKRVINQVTGATALFLQGSAGNQGPGPEGFTSDVSVAERAGQILGCEVARVFTEIRTRPAQPRFVRVWESGAPLGCWEMAPGGEDDQSLSWINRMVTLPVRPSPPVDVAQAEANRWKERLAELAHAGAAAAEIEDATWQAKRADMAARRAREYAGVTERAVELQAFRIGGAVLVGVPVEPFAQIGVAVRQGSPFAVTHFAGYTNGWTGYLPTSDAYPDGGYEVDTTPFAPGADQMLIQAARAVIQDLA